MRTSCDLLALKRQKLSDLGKREAQLLCAADKLQAFHIAILEETEAAVSSKLPPEQPLLLVKANGVDTDTGFFGYSADLHLRNFIQGQYTLWSLVQSQVENMWTEFGWEGLQTIVENGESGGARTRDHRIKSAMLYQLSYRLKQLIVV